MTNVPKERDLIDEVYEGEEELLTMTGMPFRIMNETEVKQTIMRNPRRQTNSLASRVRSEISRIPMPTVPGHDTGGVLGPFRSRPAAEKVKRSVYNAVSVLQWKRVNQNGKSIQSHLTTVEPIEDGRFVVSVIRLAPVPGGQIQ